jgi:hypothetical protein
VVAAGPLGGLPDLSMTRRDSRRRDTTPGRVRARTRKQVCRRRDATRARAAVASPRRVSHPDPPEGADNQVWVFEEHPGYRRAMESAGTVAAPLLAGFSFTLLVLLVPTLGEETTTVHVGSTYRDVATSELFSALPEVAALLLLLAGLLLIASVQAAITARYFGHAPSDLEEWYPEFFPDASSGADPPAHAAALEGWNVEGWPALRTDTKWYAGWLRRYFYEEVTRANRWAGATRLLYHAGILALLLGLTALVTPPAGGGEFWRWMLFGLALAGALAEGAWIASRSWAWAAIISRTAKPASAPTEGVSDEPADSD